MKLLTVLVLTLVLNFSLLAGEVNCQPKIEIDVNDFFNSVNNVFSISKPVGGFYRTRYNLKIEESCKERMPIKKLEIFYRNTMSEGVQCLSKLSTIGSEGPKNISCFEKLFADKMNPPKLLCGGWPFGNGIWAVGSFPGSSKRHPYLWLGPEISKLYSSNPNELKATIFHEMLHNCGYIHSEGIEIPYTCEECCFNTTLESDKKKSACNICAGKYQNENDVNYVRELLSWSRDYPGWGRDMRMRALSVAITQKNKESLLVLFKETSLSDSERNEIIDLLLSGNKDKLQIFLQAKDFLVKNDRLFKLLNIMVAEM
jgi:hypothetical protein